MQNEQFAKDLYARWDDFFLHKFERIADELFTKYDNPSEVIEIECMDLDIGTLSEAEFNDRFPVILKEKMEEVLVNFFTSEKKGTSVKRSTQTGHYFDLLVYFLLHGTFPWNADNKQRDVHLLFLEVLQTEGAKLKQFLSVYGHYTSLRQRLVYQLNDPELEKGVNLLSPETSAFIISYVQLLKAKYKEIEQPGIRERDHRDAIWLVIYAYLLQNRSSYFDKKSFIAQTILELAGKYNLSYDRMLELITRELQYYKTTLSMQPELFSILFQLQKETSEKQMKSSAVNVAKFYKILAELLQEKMGKAISDNNREALILILSRVDSCRLFLQQLKEEEIVRLVSMVAPLEADLVIDTAKSLEQQKDEGALQGKVGGEFRLLKWQIIFPVLFENKGASLNRKSFIRSIFQKISAHYNTEIALLLAYFCRNMERLKWADKYLQGIFMELWEEEISIKEKSDIISSKNTASVEYSIQLILQQKKPAPEQLQIIFDQLSRTDYRRKIIENTTDTERYLLSQWLFREDGDLIVAYAQKLNQWSEQSSLSGKIGSGFSNLKWEFLFAVMSGMPAGNFNRYSFVHHTLERIAAHYNLAFFDLLLYFRNKEVEQHLPPTLRQLLEKLFEEEKKHRYEVIFKSYRENESPKFLSVFSTQEQQFIKTYAKALDQYQTSEAGKGKISENFREIKWRFIFAVLFESQQASFNKKYIIRRTLEQIAAHYLLSYAEVLNYFYQIVSSSKNNSFAEISGIMSELRIDFIKHEEGILKLMHTLQRYLRTELNIILNDEELSTFLFQFANKQIALNRTEVLERLLKWLKASLSTSQKAELEKILLQWSKTNNVLNTTSYSNKNKHLNSNTMETKQKKESESLKENGVEMISTSYIHNAGVILLSPYLPRLFSMLELTEDGRFKGQKEQIRAIYLMQYLTFGKTDFPEHELLLNKLLTGFKIEEPITRDIELTDKERETADSLLKGTLQHWEKLKNTSVTGFREAFLQREGKLEIRDNDILLTVESKAYDMLLDSLPWSYNPVKFLWMNKIMYVKWRN